MQLMDALFLATILTSHSLEIFLGRSLLWSHSLVPYRRATAVSKYFVLRSTPTITALASSFTTVYRCFFSHKNFIAFCSSGLRRRHW
ncbi:hypothetical protein BC936DRAFT_143736 [Jimgerdemannia flammicorona]|uniref:Uncharacterized protein n=1 Tax=Jimgerdemannia flammicorona TaxID=994334 RepID=A0A432ZYR9_9FUNG|nr:hypothetical protein BC936DRAFT_143736 [Jimgerdemannia flammicorona]